MNKFSTRSQDRLDQCHPDLQVLANAVLKFHDCTVITGHRDEAEQTRVFTEKLSTKQWPDSKHNSKPSIAIDLAPYRPNSNMWEFKYSLYFAGLVLGTADALLTSGAMKHAVRWGGNWSTIRDNPRGFADVSFYDGLHFELTL
jgi:peptidoglycan L-alanyl-D-glutamate endopeptidase CwlK